MKWYDALTGLAAVREKTSIPIVSGQGEISEFASCDLARYGAVDILNTDVTLVGGITSWMRVAQFVEGMGVDDGAPRRAAGGGASAGGVAQQRAGGGIRR